MVIRRAMMGTAWDSYYRIFELNEDTLTSWAVALCSEIAPKAKLKPSATTPFIIGEGKWMIIWERSGGRNEQYALSGRAKVEIGV
jgi:hypothetical protein